MTLTVLTIVKNRAGHLAQLVEGLRRSAVQPDELVVVDMASHPPASVSATAFPVQLIRLEGSGLPLAAARNAAAQAAKGDQLLFLDVDCIPMHNLVGEMMCQLSGHDALICAEALYLGPDDARTCWDEDHLLQSARPHPVRPFPRDGVRREENAGLFWSLIFGIGRQHFFDMGGFDEAFSGYGAEDTDFGFRARDAGLPLLFMGGTGAFHQYHDVFDPPLQHVRDIVLNAAVFRARWGIWPMEGWLAAFEAMGLIRRDDHGIMQCRDASSQEMAQARKLSPV